MRHLRAGPFSQYHALTLKLSLSIILLKHTAIFCFLLLDLLGTESLVYGQSSVVDSAEFEHRPCDAFIIRSKTKIDLTTAEESLICGDKDIPAWQNIPFHQAKYFLQNFLQERGFLDPTFKEKNNVIEVDVGKMFMIKGVVVTNSPFDLEIQKYWAPIGKPLTPGQLDMIEKWIQIKLANNGFPCATIETQASKKTQKVHFKIDSGELWDFSNVESLEIPGLEGTPERRHDAFNSDEKYDARLTELTSRRLIASDLVLNSTFLPQCKSEAKFIKHTLMPGQPRLLTFGFGFDTEEYLILRASWLNGRVLVSASRLQAEGQASYRRQRIKTEFDWYYLPIASRHYLNIFNSIQRLNENRFETQEVNLVFYPTWEVDRIGGRQRLQTGVSYKVIKTPRGVGLPITKILAWDVNWSMMSHEYEYYMASPQGGSELEVFYSNAKEDFGSDIDVTRYRMSGSKLFNVYGWQPPIFVFGVRGGYMTSEPQGATQVEELPPTFRYHLGGTTDVRGFGRRSLPNTDIGALTKAYLGTELRLNNIIDYKIQPLLFIDYGLLGEEAFKLDQKTVYWSPGIGARWESPFGAMRFTLAQGMIDGDQEEDLDYLSRMQFYFSFGESF